MPGAKVPPKSCDKYHVHLTPEQRGRLLELTRTGTAAAQKIIRARVLLLADEDHPDGRRPDSYITEVLGIHRRTAVRIRQRFVHQGEQTALDRKRREQPPTPPKLDSAAEAHLVALVCSEPPAGRARWTLSLLARELTRLEVVTSICPETVRRALKKTNSSRGGSSGTASRPKTAPGSSSRWKTCSKSTNSRTPTRAR
jgi:Homeodomain-like domain